MDKNIQITENQYELPLHLIRQSWSLWRQPWKYRVKVAETVWKKDYKGDTVVDWIN